MKKNKKCLLAAIFCLALAGGFFLWVCLEKEPPDKSVYEIPGTVISVDNSELHGTGFTAIGVQLLEAVLTGGPFKGTVVEADNHMMGQWDMDEIYAKGDHILLAVQAQDGKVTSRAKAINTYRQHWELILFGLFALLLVAYAGVVGLKALASFVAVLLILWFFFLPGLLSGTPPLLLSFWVLILLSGVIIFSVAGLTRKGLAAFLGTLSGLFVTLGLTFFFGNMFKLGGMTAPFASTLILTGHFRLDMQGIFYSAVLLGASGAAMDIAMDISVSMAEIKAKRPDIDMGELIRSGLTIGRTVIGTMTTTLLLAYSGGYLTMLMLFVSQETSFTRILNMKLVAAEIFRVLMGSIGLLMVAPVTALLAGFLLCIQVSEAVET